MIEQLVGVVPERCVYKYHLVKEGGEKEEEKKSPQQLQPRESSIKRAGKIY